MSDVAKMESHAPATPTLLGIPLELRIRIYEHIYADLINELSDNIFAVLSFYDRPLRLHIRPSRQPCRQDWSDHPALIRLQAVTLGSTFCFASRPNS